MLSKYSGNVLPDRPDLYRISLMVCHFLPCLLPFCLFYAEQYHTEHSGHTEFCGHTSLVFLHDKCPYFRHLQLIHVKWRPAKMKPGSHYPLYKSHPFLTAKVVSNWPLPGDHLEWWIHRGTAPSTPHHLYLWEVSTCTTPRQPGEAHRCSLFERSSCEAPIW